jgi:hypothetical protein
MQAALAIVHFHSVRWDARAQAYRIAVIFTDSKAVISGFLLQHAIQGWCSPLPVFRRLGFRTSYEIEQERQALKALRGDFARLPSGRGRRRVQASMRAARV